MAAKSETLLKAKQQIVQDAIWNAAMDLFGKKGFDAATVDDIAAAAGVSQRTFFRYFASKSDLMGQAVLSYGELLTATILASPRSIHGFDLLRKAVLEVAARVASFPRTRDVIAIVITCPAAREAQLPGIAEVEQRVAQAYAARMKKGREDQLTARLLAGLTLTILNETMRLWFQDGRREITVEAERVMKKLHSLTSSRSVK